MLIVNNADRMFKITKKILHLLKKKLDIDLSIHQFKDHKAMLQKFQWVRGLSLMCPFRDFGNIGKTFSQTLIFVHVWIGEVGKKTHIKEMKPNVQRQRPPSENACED